MTVATEFDVVDHIQECLAESGYNLVQGTTYSPNERKACARGVLEFLSPISETFSLSYLLGLEGGFEDWEGEDPYADDVDEHEQGVRDGIRVREELLTEW